MAMKAFVVALALLGAVAFVNAADDPTVALPGVHDLKPDTFNKHVNGAKHALVEFYAPWCGHCKHLTPEYKSLGEMIQADPALRSKVVIAKVDADAHRELGDRFGVKGFPSIKWFARGKPTTDPIDYNGGRTASAFMDYIKKALEEDKGFARVEELDAHAKKFAAATDKAVAIAEAKALVAGLEGDAKANGELYVKFMEKAVEKGAEYMTKEKARLEKLLSSGSLNSAKVDEVGRKASVLGAFVDVDEE